MTIQKPPVRDLNPIREGEFTPTWQKYFFDVNREANSSIEHREDTDNPHDTSDANLNFSDVTTNNVSITKHGFAPKAPDDSTKFLDGIGAWDYVRDSDLSLTDVTTNNVSTSKHGFTPKAPNDTGKFLRGDGTWAAVGSATIDHGGLTGLGDDDHVQYVPTDGSRDINYNAGTFEIGNIIMGNYTQFESDGTVRFAGDATVWDDLPPVPITSARLGSSAPTLATFIGNIEQYTFDATNDYVVGATEVTHKYQEGSDIVPHIHWATNSADVGDTGVKWQLEFSVCNVDGSAPFAYAFTAPTITTSVDTLIPGGTAAKSHIISDFVNNVPGTGIKIGAYIVWRLNRIASATAAPASDPFALAVGFHYKIDTVGSRSISTK